MVSFKALVSFTLYFIAHLFIYVRFSYAAPLKVKSLTDQRSLPEKQLYGLGEYFAVGNALGQLFSRRAMGLIQL